MEGLEESVLFVHRNADSGVAHRKVQQPLLRVPKKIGVRLVARLKSSGAAAGRSDLDGDLALVGEFNGVANEVDQDLPQAGDVADQNFGNGVVHDISQIQPFLGGLGGQQVQRLFDAGVQLKGMAFQIQFPGFDFGKVQNVVDDGQQGVGAAAGRLDVFALFVGQFGVQQQGGHANDSVHRRANFVAHVGQKFGFSERGFLQSLVEGQQSGIALDELLLTLAQGPISRVALDQVDQSFGVIANAGNQFDLVRQLDQIVIGAHGKGLAFDLRVLIGGKDNDGCISCSWVGAELADQRQTVYARHD